MPSHIVPIAALLFSTFIMIMGSGLAGILLPIRASLEGWTPTTVGWIGTAYAVCFTAGCLIVPRLVLRVGHVRVYAVLMSILSMSMLMHALFVDPIAWMLFRGLGGFAIAGSYMVIESWLNERVTNESRGTVFSIYMIASMSGMIAGQYISPLSDPMLPTLFMIGAIIYGLALLPTALSTAQSPKPLTQVSLDLPGLFRNSPVAVVGIFLAGAIGGNWNFLAPIYGSMSGLSQAGVATMLACAMLGGVVFQYPMGRISDRIDRRIVMVFAGLIGVTVSLFMILAAPSSQWLMLGGMFLFGSVLFPIYSLTVAHANDYAEAEDFVRIASGLLIVYGVGNMTGPQLGGRLMDAFGKQGFFVAMLIGFAAFGGYALWRITRRTAIDPEERGDFQVIAMPRQQTPETFYLDPRSEDAG